jgi:hypothetical protein
MDLSVGAARRSLLLQLRDAFDRSPPSDKMNQIARLPGRDADAPLVSTESAAAATALFDAAVAACADALHDSVRVHLLDWYEAACRALEVVRAGPAAVRACSAETGTRPHTLRRWAFAANRLSLADVESLARWRDSSGRPLSVWHLIELARLTRPRRASVLGEMEARVWPVVKLRQLGRTKSTTVVLRGSDDHAAPRREAVRE